ncbi:hypothetical protein BH09SUM1_BH09SUM1_17250 [soil metagenome]
MTVVRRSFFSGGTASLDGFCAHAVSVSDHGGKSTAELRGFRATAGLRGGDEVGNGSIMLTETPPDIAAILQQADALRGARRFSEARKLLEAEIRRDSSNWEVLRAEAELLCEIGDHALAERLLDEYVSYYSHNSEAAAHLARVRWQTDRKDEALAELEAAVRRDPSAVLPRQWLIDWLLEKAETGRAIIVGEAAVSAGIDAPCLLVSLAKAHLRANHRDKAEKFLRQALEADPDAAEAAPLLAETLLQSQRRTEAIPLIDRFAESAGASPSRWLRTADLYFRANLPERAFQFLIKLITETAADSAPLQRSALDLCVRNAGQQETDRLYLSHLHALQLLDSAALEYLEFNNGRANKSAVVEAFRTISAQSLRYRRTMTRILSAFYGSPLPAQAIPEWIRTHHLEIESDAVLWGGVGAYYVEQRRWNEAADHLIRWWGRPGVMPWMLLLLGRALEELGRVPDANTQYRHALQMPPDHSEGGIRSRLAFNLSMEWMHGAASIIATDCSPRGRGLSTAADRARILAVEAFSAAGRFRDFQQRSELFEEALIRMKEMAQGASEAEAVMRIFRQRSLEILSQSMTD